MRFTKTLGSALALSLTIGAVTPQEADARRGRYEHRDNKKRNTLIGAGIGLLGGAIVSGGDPWATIGGAAAGGVIGNVTTNDRRDRNRRWDNRRDRRDRYYRR